MPYRGDETDPLEVIISQRRAVRRGLILAVVWMALPSFWGFGYSRVGRLLTPPAAAPAQTVTHTVLPPPKKITAVEVEEQLRRAVTSSNTPQDQICSAGSSGWDYVCSYRSGPNPKAPRRKIGVLVGPSGIRHASMSYPIDRVLPDAPRATSAF